MESGRLAVLRGAPLPFCGSPCSFLRRGVLYLGATHVGGGMEPEGARDLASQIHGCLSARDWPAARESLACYCETWPNHRKAWYLRAFVEWSLGNVRQAEEFVEKALAISPTYSRALQLRERLVAREDSFLSDNVDLATGRFLGPPDVVVPAGAEGSSAWAPAGEEDAEASRAARATVHVPAVQAQGELIGGRYRLQALLGSGGMGHVWKGLDTQLHDRVVAIKRVYRKLLASAQGVERFEREVQALAGLNHPYIVGVIDSGQDDEGFYYVMEFVEGTTLRDWLTSYQAPQWPSYEDALTIFTQLCRAVAFAHSKRVIHRDLKPENVIITADNAVQILDFGLARCVSHEVLTSAGQAFGTPHYMAPELVRGGTADERSDIYALGVILFELATLRRPFEGENVIAVILQQERTSPPSPRTFREDVAEGLELATLRALARDPEQRYQGVRELLAVVQKALSGKLASSPPETKQGVFRQLAKAAWLDGVLTDQEREFLLSRAEDMGITPERAKAVLADARS